MIPLFIEKNFIVRYNDDDFISPKQAMFWDKPYCVMDSNYRFRDRKETDSLIAVVSDGNVINVHFEKFLKNNS